MRLPERGGDRRAWVDALNREDWAEACELTARWESVPCERILKQSFESAAGDLSVQGFYRSGNRTTFALGGHDDLSPTVERDGDGYLVHFDIAVIK